jgi:hypothetical protein
MSEAPKPALNWTVILLCVIVGCLALFLYLQFFHFYVMNPDCISPRDSEHEMKCVFARRLG